MKTQLRNWSKVGMVLTFLVIGFSFSQKCFSQGDIFPLSENSFTGAGSFCHNSPGPNMTYSFNTDVCGTSPFSAIDITVSWFSNGTNSTSGGSLVYQEISTTATTTFNYTAPTTSVGTLYYYVEVSWGTGLVNCASTGTLVSSTTQEVIVNAIQPVSVSISASATTICAGTSVTFTATPTNGGSNPSYQWKVNGVNAGTNSPTFTTSTLVNGNIVTVELTSDASPCATGNPATSNPITMTVNALQPVSVSISASATTICAGTSVTFTATPTNGGAGPSYQWKVNGINAGTNSATFTTSTLINGDIVTVLMTSNIAPCATGNPATSNPIAMTVNPILPVSVSISASATTICSGASVTFTATPTNGGVSPSYQWKVNGVNAGPNSPVFTTSTLVNGNIVTVVLTSSAAPCVTGNPATSTGITMTVNALPSAVTVTPSAATICEGSIQSFTASSGSSTTASSGTINLTIPDNNTNGVANTINVSTIPAGAVITGISVNFNITEGEDGDLYINLKAPNANVLNLVNRRGGSNNNFTNTTVSSASATSFATGNAPYTGTFAADGANAVGANGNISNVTTFPSLYSTANGNWIISVRDANSAGFDGTLNSWSITITWSYPITWTPITGLYSDAAATIAYTAGQVLGTIYAKPAAAGTFVYTATATGANGCTTSNTATLTVNPRPTVSATPASQSICTGSAISTINITNPNSVPGTTLTWTRTTPGGLTGTVPASGSGSTISGTFTNSTTAPITTTFTITATAGSCSSSTTVTVTVNPIPTVSATNTTQTVCSGTNITNIVITNPNNVAGTTFSWTRDNTINLSGLASGTGSPISGALTNNTNVQQVTVFTITASVGGCSTSTTATITVNPRPTVSATPATQTVCSGVAITQIDITNPNSVAGTAFTWTRDNTVNITGLANSGSGASINGTPGNATATQQTTNYTITATAGTCSSTATVNVKVNPIPTVNAISNLSYCNNGAGAAINFGSNVAGATFSWTSTANVGFGTSGNGNIPAFTTTGAPITATVSVTATAGGCPGPVRTFTITINSLPSVTVTADYCIVPGKVRLTANPLPAGSYTYSWSNGASTQVIDVDIAGSYTVTVTNGNGCQATNTISISTELAVNGNFEAGNVGFISGYEFNNTANGLQPEGRYAVNSNPQFTHTNFWGKDHTTGTGKMMIVNGVVGPTVWQETVAVVPNTTYYFSAWALSLNNLSPFAQLQFSVNGNIIGTSAVLVAGVNNNSLNTNWQRFYGIWSSGPLSSATCSIVDLQGALGGNDFAIDDISISTLSPAAFTVTPSILGGGTAVCQGNTLNLSANLTGGSSPYTFSWTGPNGFTSNLENPSIPNTTAANAGTYTVTATDFYGCITVGSRVITVNAPPGAPSPVTATPATICIGSNTNLNGTTPAGSQSDFAGNYTTTNWSFTNNPGLTGGSVNTAGAPISISITSGNNGTIGNTDYTITNGPVAGNFTFNWNYVTTETTANDIPQYSVNGGAAVNMTGFSTVGAAIQSGTATIAVGANQTLALRMRTTTGLNGSATTTFSNFSGPLAGSIMWYNVPTGGSNIGTSVSAANFSVTPPSTGTNSYYAEAISPIGCQGTTRTQVNVTVNTAPSFSLCPSNVVTTVTAGTCSKVVTYSATATGSASPTLTYVFTGATTGSGSGTGSGAAFNKGVTTVTITANTGCAPNATCSFTITVNDNEAPVFSLCPSNVTKNTGAGVCTYTSVGTEFNSTATDNCSFTNTAALTGATTGTGIASLAGRVFNKGVTTVTWTASDGTNTVTCVFTVTVVDNQSPNFSACPSNLTRNTAPGVCTYTAAGSEFNSPATDNCSVTSNTAVLTGATTGSGFSTLAGQVFNKGVTTVTWTATDGVNTNSCTFNVTVNDNQLPTYSVCPSNAVRNAGAGICTYTSVGSEFNSTANDNCSVTSKTAVLTGATTGTGITSLTGQVFNKGVTTVTWTASDGLNNANCTFTVTVNDNQAPVYSTCPTNVVKNADPGLCTYTSVGTEFNSAATDNCSVTSKTAVLTGATTGTGITSLIGQVFNKGVTTVTWTASDGVNNTTCVFTVTVNDTQFPIISSCPSDIVSCNPSPSLGSLVASDNCSGMIISNNAPGTFPVGTTVVTWTATDASGNAVTCTQNVTVNPPAPSTPAGISGSTMVCEETAGFTYTIAPSAFAMSYIWTVPTGWTITSGTGTTTITVTSGTAGQSGNITVASTNACGTSGVSSLPVIITSKGTWMGVNTEWNDASNWCGGIPTSITDVIIPVTGSGFYPLVSTATATAHSITIITGASVTVSGQVIEISGSISNAGTFDITNGTLELNGPVASQNIAGSMFAAKTIRNLRISNTNGVNITGVNDTLKISGIVKFGVSNAVVNTNNNLTLLSSASGTASVGDMTNSGANSGNNIIGNVTVERFIPNHFKAWQFLAVPAKGQTINAAWQEGNTPLSNSNNPGYGTIITSNVANAVALGFDVYTPSGPTMKSYDAATNGWIGVANPAQQIANQKGYMLFVRGDRSVTAFNQPATATILRTTGQLYTIGADAPPTTNVNAGTFEAIGNPYASAINFGNVTKDGGVQDLFYVWDPKLTTSPYSAYGLGAYQTVIGPGPDYIVVPGGGSYSNDNSNIESGQAFLVHAPFASGSVSFTETCKADGSNLVTKPVGSHVKQLRNNLYVFTGGNRVLLDGTIAQFDAAYSNDIDPMDALKVANSSENLALLRNGTKLVAERRSNIQSSDTLFYNLGLVRVQQYQFEFIASQLDHDGLAAFLEDNYLHTSTPVDLSDTTTVMFSVENIPGSYAADRFRLVFKQLAPTPVTITSVSAARNSDKTIAVNWKVENETNIQVYTVERSENGSNFAGILTSDPTANNGGRASYTRNDLSPLAHDNFYRIKALSFSGQVQYSNIVKVAPLKSIPGITVYPNPVTGKFVQLEFTDLAAGTYSILLIHANGAQQKLSSVQLSSTHSIQSVKLPQLLASGIYRLQITGPDNNIILKTIQVSYE